MGNIMVKSGMEGHVIVCGYGVVGQKVVDVLVEHGIRFIVIEIDPKKVEHLKELGHSVIEGDATYSRVLKSAGVEEAKAIAVVLLTMMQRTSLQFLQHMISTRNYS